MESFGEHVVYTITRRTKYLLLEFSELLGLLTGLALTPWIHDDYITVTIILVKYLQLVILLVLVALVYLPDIHCHRFCKCFKRAPDQRPLLVNSGTRHTNPASVWGHANDPSYTVYNPPPVNVRLCD